VETRGALLVKEIARASETAVPPAERLERVMATLFAAFDDGLLCQLLIEGWSRARRSKALRLELAWIREQLRLSVGEVLKDGIRAGVFRSDLDPEAMAAVILGAAEGLLLQSANQGGPVPAERLADSLLRAVLRNPAERPAQPTGAGQLPESRSQ
jgi:hypothetical protein